jgi:uncharacterized protein (DUF1501 family)
VATDIWSTADPDQRLHDGWIGRYFDCTCKGTDQPDPRQGIAITQEAPLAMIGGRFNPVSFGSPDELSWRSPGGSAQRVDAFQKLNGLHEGDAPSDAGSRNQATALSYLERVAMDARASASQIQRAAGSGLRRQPARNRPAGGRGGALALQLGMVRRMIAARLPTRVYYVSLGGFDTHAQQTFRHQQLMTQLGDALATFAGELRSDGLLDRVLIMTFSEFGRRVAENASQGTDHGAAAPLFVVGGGVRPGIHTPHPSLEPDKLDRGDLAWNTDFRSVYATVLTRWLRSDAGKILGGRFSQVAFMR